MISPLNRLALQIPHCVVALDSTNAAPKPPPSLLAGWQNLRPKSRAKSKLNATSCANWDWHWPHLAVAVAVVVAVVVAAPHPEVFPAVCGVVQDYCAMCRTILQTGSLFASLEGCDQAQASQTVLYVESVSHWVSPPTLASSYGVAGWEPVAVGTENVSRRAGLGEAHPAAPCRVDSHWREDGVPPDDRGDGLAEDGVGLQAVANEPLHC